jgi:serine/threonine-protein kinase
LAAPVSLIDDGGTISTVGAEVTNWGDPAFSADGRRLAVDIFDGKQAEIWIYDLTAGTLSRLTHDLGVDAKPVWSPDGSRVAFINVCDNGAFCIAWHRADGSGDTHILWSATNGTLPTSFHPTGKFLAYVELDPRTSFDVKVLPLSDDGNGNWKAGTPLLLATTTAVEFEPTFSPDGRWIAYSSTSSGRPEIYVRPFPGPGGTWQVSTSGGNFPTWSRAGNELLYATADQRLMAVRYSAEVGTFRAGSPRIWTNQRHRLMGPTTRNFDLHPDGKRVVFAKAADAAATSSDPVVMVFNFFDELRRLVPAPRN